MNAGGGERVRPVIGMEIHVQLRTRTKMFCACPVEVGAEPNTRTCPVCLALPGSLPVMNRQALEFAILVGLALNCRIARRTKWDRKSYYYPDLPKNYQISQYDLPLNSDGWFELPTAAGPKRIGIIRAHLEEDAGKNVHDLPGGTGVDLNRAGTPLLEIVTKPDISSAEEAYSFAVELQRLMVYLGVSEGVMQKGQMRFEPNVNLHIEHDGRLYRTPIAEIKNLNSFRALRSAIEYELERQLAEWRRDHDYTLEKVGKINCGWRDDVGQTEIQRAKEEAHDYRYFPEPDLVPVVTDESWLEEIRSRLPELPAARRQRLMSQYGMKAQEAEQIVADRATADLFDAAIAAGADPGILTKHFISFWAQYANEKETTVAGLGVSGSAMAELVRLQQEGRVTATASATIAAKMVADPQRRPADIARAEGLEQMQDTSAVEALVEQAIAENPQAVADYLKGGKKSGKALGFLQGVVMRASRGSAPPQLVRQLLEQKLKG